MKKVFALAGIIFILGLSQIGSASAKGIMSVPAPATTLWFSGYQWIVRSGSGGPGPNLWNPANLWLDPSGYLHLKITHSSGRWVCAELYTVKSFGFGKYQFNVVGAIDKLDPNAVLGLFNYPTSQVGIDGTNEIDIEFSHWGDPTFPIGNYTVWPAQNVLVGKSTSKTFNFSLTNPDTTQRFTWSSQSIYFQSLRGFHNDNTGQYAGWLFKPGSYLKYIPQHAIPVHINLWLSDGNPPVNGQGVEVVIRSFRYTP